MGFPFAPRFPAESDHPVSKMPVKPTAGKGPIAGLSKLKMHSEGLRLLSVAARQRLPRSCYHRQIVQGKVRLAGRRRLSWRKNSISVILNTPLAPQWLLLRWHKCPSLPSNERAYSKSRRGKDAEAVNQSE